MKIRKIEFENFRNFKNYETIQCSTDGRITIIYGKNGDGKTTLHQLFQWVFYGEVHFNKTTNNHLYNLEFERDTEYGQNFNVWGRIDFEHDGDEFSLTRKYIYRKGIDDSQKIAEEISLNKMDEDNNWRRMDRPTETIEKLLPSGLAEYFFFDGESMIADLRVKGKDSAGKLRQALYSMFDLDIIEAAISHIGRTDLKSTVLGKLYMSKGAVTSGSAIAATKTNIENIQNKMEGLQQKLEQLRNDKREKKEYINSISEQIGNTKSKAEYEKQRNSLIQSRDAFLKNVKTSECQFGEEVMRMFPTLLVSKAIKDAKNKLHLKVDENSLPQGLGKRLLTYLLLNSTKECICGEPLCDKKREKFNYYLSLMPPKSYASMYSEFNNRAIQEGKLYEPDRILERIKMVLDNMEEAEKCDVKIKELDEQEKKSPDIENLVVERNKAEASIEDIDENIVRCETEIKKAEIYLKNQMSIYDKQTKDADANVRVSRKISIMQSVCDDFAERLDAAALEYSSLLEENIQNLLDKMLTSKRNVKVSKEFAVRVIDSFNDESKSEGQFAVVSFAYIGGILKMLKSQASLASKEYPLVLDGPFSKLDPDQRQNVVDTIPEFAPQVIIFSKDDLHDVIQEEKIGRVWTIVSNEEKNVAKVEEGKLWK